MVVKEFNTVLRTQWVDARDDAMLKVLTCLHEDHDFRFILGAAAVCLLATCTTLWLYQRNARQSGALRLGWLAVSGLASGSGVWATHFIAMLAFRTTLKTGYEVGGTELSFVLAVAASTGGLALASLVRGRAGPVLGGLAVGGGVSLMHYVGMAAFRPQGLLMWDRSYVAASVAIGIGFSVAALLTAGRQPHLKRLLAAAALLTLAICGMHFTGMAALSILPDPTVIVPDEFAPRAALAWMVAAVTAPLLIAAVLIAAGEATSAKGALHKLRAATDAMPAALAFFDAEDRLVVWNSTYEASAPFPPAALKAGRSFEQLLRSFSTDEGLIAEHIRERREFRSMEYRFGDRWIHVENQPTGDGGMVTIGTDVTELKRDSEALTLALAQAEAANRAKSEFLANISHEIRTPLNGVAGVAAALGRTPLDAGQREMLELIRASADTVDGLLADILDLSQIEAGKVRPVRVRFNLADALRTAAAEHRTEAERKGIALYFDLAAETQVEVVGDMVRLKQALGCLIGNAVKFTERGEVRVAAQALGPGRYRIEVRDTGVGFDAGEKARLFESFAQADGSATRRHGGAGLGLALAQHCAALLEAELDCESAVGAGSLFSLDLPLATGDDDAECVEPGRPGAANHLDSAASAEEPFRVLIVDDNATNRRVLQLILSPLGADWIAAEDGVQAIEAFEAARFDLILMDIQMPVMDGLTATREIRRREAEQGLPATPIIVVSANCLPEHVAAAQAAGAQRHLAKPVSALALTTTISEVLDARQRRAA